MAKYANMHTESFKKRACNSVPRAPPIFAGPFYCCRKQEYTGMLMPFRLKKSEDKFVVNRELSVFYIKMIMGDVFTSQRKKRYQLYHGDQF
jgi:hypothetical protein